MALPTNVDCLEFNAVALQRQLNFLLVFLDLDAGQAPMYVNEGDKAGN